MRVRVPEYFNQFRCLAGNCPHSCCVGWEVVVDEDTARRYAAVPGALGEKLRAALQVDEDGDICFPLRGGRCPFLDGENLCEIHRQLGQEATSLTCQEHPRFAEEYGPFQEISLSASCPAANALLLGSREPLRFLEYETSEPEEPGDPWLAGLLPLRERMLAILQDRTRPLGCRLEEILILSADAQPLLDEDRGEALEDLAQTWQMGARTVPAGEGLFPGALRFLASLEVLEPDWPELLRCAETAPAAQIPEELLERIGAYFLFRYLLKTVNDGDLVSWTALCVVCVLIVQRVAAVCGIREALRRVSAEIEHSAENLDALRSVFGRMPSAEFAALLRQLRTGTFCVK